ncbi:MAG: DUF58 domain-containing protein [Planctomycetales bacterium]|nr:DUF58 domain-containing protein [Planctomycetales bacterium]
MTLNTLYLLIAVLIPFAFLAWRKKISPHRPLVLAAAILGVLSIGLVLLPGMFWGIVLADAAILGLAIIDFVSLPRRPQFLVERTTGRVASLQKPHRAALTITNRSKRDVFVWVSDGVPEEMQADPEELPLILAAESRSSFHFEISASRRGLFRLTTVYLRVRSRLGLWSRQIEYPCESVIHVYPDMKQLSEYALLARTNRLNLIGMRRARRIGGDNEFERLRDYTPDDNYKYIDWRSTARRNKLTVRDFQANQSQRIIFLVDCGRMMTGEAAGVSLLDHAFNSMLMLAYVALSRGDQVGMVSFADTVHNYVPLRGGANQMNRLQHACFDRFPRMVESRYDDAFFYLASHCRKRTLVVLITNVIDEVNAHQLRSYLGNLVGRHLPLGVLLRDHAIFDAADVPVGAATAALHDESLYRAAAAAEILSWRHQVIRDLESQGVLSLDVFPESMTAPLVNRYLDIKARHLL